MEKQTDYAQLAHRDAETEGRYGTYVARPPRYSVDSMAIFVNYIATVGRVEFFKRGDEHIFIQTKTLPDRTKMKWDSVRENAHSIRDEFLKVKTVGHAIEFLQKTGEFSPLRTRLSWTEFQKWQMFAALVQEHDELAAAMRSNSWSGECGEVLKALTGIYPSSFFDGCEDALYVWDEPQNDPGGATRRLEDLTREVEQAGWSQEWFERQKRELTTQAALEERERNKELRRRDLWQWFISPPVAIEWAARSEEAAQEALKGSKIEFLLRQDQLAPVLVITPKYTLQAIAAAIYAERIEGVTFRKCEWCGELFPIRRQKNKRFCGTKRCKGNAKKARQRAAPKKRKEVEPAASKQLNGTAKTAKP